MHSAARYGKIGKVTVYREPANDVQFRRARLGRVANQLDECIRLTWREETRDEVLARLLHLNRVKAEVEAKQIAEAPKPAARVPSRPKERPLLAK